jgi:hypothetical protein
MMNINLHIERLVVDGLAMPHQHRPIFQAAVEAELGRLLGENGLMPGMMTGGSWPSLAANAIQLASGSNPNQLGQQVAQAVFRGIGRP